jgi:hypothetical protein
VVWIHASNPTRFEQGYRDIADNIPIPGREDPKADILQLVCAWLSDRRNGQWLMILDNADDDSVFFAADEDSAGTAQISDITSHTKPLESFLPQTPNGMVLITSRNRIAAINLAGTCGSIVQVEPMDEEDALALLNTRVPFSEPSKADAKALVQALEHIPSCNYPRRGVHQYKSTYDNHVGLPRTVPQERGKSGASPRQEGFKRPSARPQHTACGYRDVADLVHPNPEDGAVSCRSTCADEHVR